MPRPQWPKGLSTRAVRGLPLVEDQEEGQSSLSLGGKGRSMVKAELSIRQPEEQASMSTPYSAEDFATLAGFFDGPGSMTVGELDRRAAAMALRIAAAVMKPGVMEGAMSDRARKHQTGWEDYPSSDDLATAIRKALTENGK